MRHILLIIILAAVGCDGSLTEKPRNGSTDAGLINNVTPPVCPDPNPATPPTPADGHHDPGSDCILCHVQGGSGTPFTYAGTIYTDNSGATPLAGAIIHLKTADMVGGDVFAVSGTNGNFWGTDNINFPVIAFVSSCPAIHGMNASIETTGVSCNTSGCHTSGARLHP